MKVVISRNYSQLETTGCLYVFSGDISVFNCNTIELPWKDNNQNTSCIPEGTYDVIKTISPTKGKGMIFLLKDVPNRTAIEIHIGNYVTGNHIDTEGCILPGMRFVDINNDGSIDVADSSIAMKKLLTVLPDKFQLTII
jgi:hypothetical protein